MRSRRAPDRVHVVRPPQPENDGSAPRNDARNIEIVRMLAQISDKLKRSEAERYELLAELREYRKSLNELEDKSEQTEKAYLTIQNKIQHREKIESELTQRQARFERALKETADKMVKSAAGQALIDKRLNDAEERQTAIDERLNESVSFQARLERQLEKSGQDRSRMQRKMERLEEIVVETQDSLRAKAMVLLTDQSTAAQSNAPQIPAWLEHEERRPDSDMADMPWWRRSVRMQSIGMAAMVVAALLTGWAINQIQQPDIPQIAVLEGGGLARLNLRENRWEPVLPNDDSGVPAAKIGDVTKLEEQKLSSRLGEDQTSPASEQTAATAEPVQIVPNTIETAEPAEADNTNVAETQPSAQAQPEGQEQAFADQTPAAQEALNYSDEELLAALEENPEELAGQLNEIAPAVSEALELDEPVQQAEPVTQQEPQSTVSTMDNFEQVAFTQNPAIEREIQNNFGEGPLAQQMAPDPNLPEIVKNLENQAYQGIAEAQHDLAAIYTAGHGGVEQNFDKAAFWFRQASQNGIGNARYNLGVLYHQGLGVERDLGKALYWYREAAKVGHPEAQYNLGIAHIEGIGTDYNPELAAAFFERAANNGIMEAAYNLGLIHENALLGEADPNEALLWYKIAADQGSPDAQAALKQLSSSLQIGMEDVDKMVGRMQSIYEATHGRKAGSAGAQESAAQASSVNERQVVTAQIQEFLMGQGLYPGPADGINGPQTADAIRSYQSRNGLQVTGEVSDQLLAHMLGQGSR